MARGISARAKAHLLPFTIDGWRQALTASEKQIPRKERYEGGFYPFPVVLYEQYVK